MYTKSLLLQVIIEVNEDVNVVVDGTETRLVSNYGAGDQLFTDDYIVSVLKDSLIDSTRHNDTIMWQVRDISS